MPAVYEAKQNGFDDVLWMLDDYITEMSILNVFVLQQSRRGHLELSTPPDDGCICNGITRKTILEMSKEIEDRFGIVVNERQLSIHELINSSKEDRLLEMFGAAPHSPLLPVNRVVYRDTRMHLEGDPLRGKIYDGIEGMLRTAMETTKYPQWITPIE